MLERGTCPGRGRVLGFLWGARVLWLLLRPGFEGETGGQPDKARGEPDIGLPGWITELALTPAVTMALILALVDKRGRRVGGVSLLGGWRGIGGTGRHCIA